MKKYKSPTHSIQLWRRCAHVALFEIDYVNALFYFAPSDQSEMVDWWKSKSLARYHV